MTLRALNFYNTLSNITFGTIVVDLAKRTLNHTDVARTHLSSNSSPHNGDLVKSWRRVSKMHDHLGNPNSDSSGSSSCNISSEHGPSDPSVFLPCCVNRSLSGSSRIHAGFDAKKRLALQIEGFKMRYQR